ncbi:MAG: ornithine carbamoyltransferase [Proteobacteria bacterium]|nr:ornithine carbamoyltransferase [Pseudomonadota bacterium]
MILGLSARADLGRPLAGQGVALVFQKPSARTRNSMEMAVAGLGGHPVYITDAEVGLGSGRESPADVARTLACFHSLIAARVFHHEVLQQMAAAADAPVLNLLSDRAHPLQTLADLLTLHERFGRLEGLRVAYVGDGDNNVARSLAAGCVRLGAHLAIAAPVGSHLSAADLAELNSHAGCVTQTVDPAEAVAGAQAVYTDTWISMGQEGEAQSRRAIFEGYQVDPALMARAAPQAVFLHCLPAHRGEEVAPEVLDGPQSLVWTQARNRMRSARGALAWMLGVPA